MQNILIHLAAHNSGWNEGHAVVFHPKFLRFFEISWSTRAASDNVTFGHKSGHMVKQGRRSQPGKTPCESRVKITTASHSAFFMTKSERHSFSSRSWAGAAPLAALQRRLATIVAACLTPHAVNHTQTVPPFLVGGHLKHSWRPQTALHQGSRRGRGCL